MNGDQVQTYVDLWACFAAAVAAGACAMRANMLKPHRQDWGTPAMLWVPLMGLAIVQAMASISIGGGSHATAREALVYSASAASSLVMVWNLHRQTEAARRAPEISQ